MKSRLIQSGLVIFSMIGLLCTANTQTVQEVKYDYVNDTPVSGICALTPDVNETVEKTTNEATEVALEAPKTPELATLTYQTYVRMGIDEEAFYDDLELLALVALAEAENQSELGKRLVIDTVLNRMDSPYWRDDDTISEVINHPYQFTSMSNGRIDRVEINEEITELVVEELVDRTNYDVVYFNTGDYSYSNHIIHEGDHYFCGQTQR